MPDQVPDEVKEYRQGQLMALQSEISKQKMNALLEKEVRVLIDGPSQDHPWAKVGRMATQAPEVDGQVFIDGSEKTLKQDILFCENTQAQEDLAGEVVSHGAT